MNTAGDTCFRVHGLDCAEEVAVLEREVGPVVGGAGRLAFDILDARMIVRPGLGAVTEAAVRYAPVFGVGRGKAVDGISSRHNGGGMS